MDTSGAIVNSYAYDEWGNITSQTEGISNPFKYTGEIYDEETGLYYLRARYYDPSIGRFLNEDTYEGQIDNPLSQNSSTYVHNNPLIFSDPSGNIPTPSEAAVMAQDIYGATANDYGTSLDGGWKLTDIKTNDEGLKMGIYSRVKTDGTIEYAIVNKGTTPSSLSNWVNNVQQPIGYSTDMEDSIKESTIFVKSHENNEVTMVGHSKGGAEAIANAVANNKNAITFNTAIPKLSQYGLSKNGYSRVINNYVVEGEILNNLFGRSPIGNTIYLPKQYKTKWWQYNKKIKNHSMDAVKNALTEAGY